MIRAEDLISKFQHALDVKGGYIWGTSGKIWTERDQANTGNEQAIKYGSKWIGHQVWDCSGLFRWAYRQLGTDCAHGSNSIFKRYCKETGRLKNGKRTDGKEMKPGTAVFTGVEGDHGHIGLYIGGGWVIEAKGTQYGVVKSKVTESKWTFWGELTAVEYGSAPETPGDQEDRDVKTLRRGDKGEAVKDLQKKLISLGYALPRYGADGDFGKETEAAVKAFQADNGLKADGIAGEKTMAALEKAKPMQLYTVIIPGQMRHEAEALVKNYPGATMKEE